MVTWIPNSQMSYIPITAMKFSQKTDHELFSNIWMRFSLNGDNYFCYTIQGTLVWDKDWVLFSLFVVVTQLQKKKEKRKNNRQ